MAMMHRYALIL